MKISLFFVFIVEWLGMGRECVRGKKRMHKNQNYMRVNLGVNYGSKWKRNE